MEERENSAVEKKEGDEREQETGRTKRGNKKIYILYLEREPKLKTKHIIKEK